MNKQTFTLSILFIILYFIIDFCKITVKILHRFLNVTYTFQYEIFGKRYSFV